MDYLVRLATAVLVFSVFIIYQSQADTSTISASEAAQHIGQNATVEGVVTAVTTSGKGNTFINFGGVYPNQTFTGWIPAGTPLA